MEKSLIEDIYCPLARTISIIGKKWTPLILRDFFLNGDRKYQELIISLEGVSPNLLSKRIKELEEHKLIEKELYSTHPPRYTYRLTEKGLSLKPIMLAMRKWGEKYTRFK